MNLFKHTQGYVVLDNVRDVVIDRAARTIVFLFEPSHKSTVTFENLDSLELAVRQIEAAQSPKPADASPHTVLDDIESIYFDVAKHVPPDTVGKLAAVLPLVARLRALVP